LSGSAAYVVRNKQLDLNIAIVDISSLHLHEDIIPELLRNLVESIEADGYVKHPIIADKDTLVVLDGVHRIAALRKMGFKRVPACLVDYNTATIKVYGWYRTIKDDLSQKEILKQVREVGPTLEETQDFSADAIGVSPTVAAIRFKKATFLAKFPYSSLEEAYAIIGQIEQRLKTRGLILRYETESDALRSLKEGRVGAVLCTPKLGKKDIVEEAKSGHVFAYKATRHVIPARPLSLNVPLSLLKGDDKSLADANSDLKRLLQKRRLRRLPPGSIVDGRRYEEELYVFE